MKKVTEAQVPAKGIVLNDKYGSDCESYSVECDCTDPNHAIHVWLEVDDQFEELLVVTFFTEQTLTPKTFLDRLKMIWKLVTGRNVALSQELILGPQAAYNFTTVINNFLKKHNAI